MRPQLQVALIWVKPLHASKKQKMSESRWAEERKETVGDYMLTKATLGEPPKSLIKWLKLTKGLRK